jgi:signal transduction histidine kinase
MKGFDTKSAPPTRSAAGAAAACLLALALGLVVLSLAPNADRLSGSADAVPYVGVVLAWGFVAAGTFAWLRGPGNRTGPLMIAVGLATVTAGLQLSDAALPFLLGALVDSLVVALLVHLLLGFPSGRLEAPAARIVVGAGYVTATLLHVPQLLLGSDYGCTEPDCPANLIEVADAPGAVDVLESLHAAAQLAVVVAAVVLLVVRRRAASRVERRGLDPVLGLGAVIVALGGVSLMTDGEAAQLAFLCAFALLPAAFVLGLVRSRIFRAAAVGRVLERLSAAGGVRDALRAALGDPSLAVAYWLPEQSRYVDADGAAVAVPPGDGRAVTEIAHRGRRVGALVHAAELRDAPELLDEVAGAAALAIENGRLEAELRARLEALRASRARLVEASDAERRRLTRDLHDGAQQRLVSLKIDLQLARERWDAAPAAAREQLERALANAEGAVEELRELAAGIHPAVLTQRGLDAAIEGLATRAPLPVEFETALPGRLPAAVETAAYFVVAEALTNVAKYAAATHARVDVRQTDGELVVEVRDDGAGGAVLDGGEASGHDGAGRGSGLRGLADRVGALDGALELESAPGAGTLVRARIPLASAAQERDDG